MAIGGAVLSVFLLHALVGEWSHSLQRSPHVVAPTVPSIQWRICGKELKLSPRQSLLRDRTLSDVAGPLRKVATGVGVCPGDLRPR